VSLGADNATWVRPFGSATQDGWDVVIDAAVEGWQHTGLSAGSLAEGESRTIEAGEWEHLVVPLSGAVRVTTAPTPQVEGEGGQEEVLDVVLAGRESVFSGPTDVAYVTRDTALTVTAHGGPARVAVCAALATARHTPAVRHVESTEVPVELRGAGRCSREVRNFGIPGVLGADSLIACEVVTPAGNWSSYPPHKHDEERAGSESELEEIYYFETQPAIPGGTTDAVAYQRVYGTAERPVDVLAEVRSGDVVLVPHGWHGPAMAAPDADLYYLNVMAGPGPERAWLICDDPAHAAVRDEWPAQQPDPRLPLGGARSE
jgi:5-deoxy-glucuronate isomerase